MNICHVSDSERHAAEEMRDFIERNNRKVKCAMLGTSKKVKMDNGDEHYFMSVVKYNTWKVGREFMLNGKMYGGSYKDYGD